MDQKNIRYWEAESWQSKNDGWGTSQDLNDF